jgi:hypothetical protein
MTNRIDPDPVRISSGAPRRGWTIVLCPEGLPQAASLTRFPASATLPALKSFALARGQRPRRAKSALPAHPFSTRVTDFARIAKPRFNPGSSYRSES